MAHRMRVCAALVHLMTTFMSIAAFVPGTDGPVSRQDALEGGNTTLFCDSTPDTSNDELMLLVWYKDNVPIYSFDARIGTEWSSANFNTSSRLKADVGQQPTKLTVSDLRGDDQALYHCRVDFLLAPTRNTGVNLTVIVLPSQPFFLDELGNKVENKIGPYHEGDTLVLSCLVIGGRPPPRISWYSGETLVDASDGVSDIPGVRENELYLPLTRDNAQALSCRASNTHLTPPIKTALEIELYLAAYNVSIHWVGPRGDALSAGRPAVARCVARGAHPAPDLLWWLDRHHLTHHSNQSIDNVTQTAVSYLEITPSVADNGATLACIATNSAMAPGRDSKADVVVLNVTYSPIVEVVKEGDGRLNEVQELDPLRLVCDAKANPPVENYTWYFNDVEIAPSAWGGWGAWDGGARSRSLQTAARRALAGRYACAAHNALGRTLSEPLALAVLYPPECLPSGITLVKETLRCNVGGIPEPDTYFWHIQTPGEEAQHLTTGSPILPLSQIVGSLSGTLEVKCSGANGVSASAGAGGETSEGGTGGETSEGVPGGVGGAGGAGGWCRRAVWLGALRPAAPRCDLAYEYREFYVRCATVENATHYEVSVWRLSATNASLVLARRAALAPPLSHALARAGATQQAGVEAGEAGVAGVAGAVGALAAGDEAGAAACNRYGCSRALLLRPAPALLAAAAPRWWAVLVERDVGIAAGALVLVLVFVGSSALLVRAARRRKPRAPRPAPPAPRAEIKLRASGSLRSCSSGSSECSAREWLAPPPALPPVQPPAPGRPLSDAFPPRAPPPAHPPPDVTLTLHRESAV